ncbi:MAG: hypothetical protein ACYDA8_09685 [Deferrisomatales bacterium]
MRDDYLFCEKDLFGVLEGNILSATQAVEGIPAEQFERATDEELVEHIFASSEVVPLEVFPDEMVMEQSETRVDVSHDPMRAWGGRGHGGPLMVPGLRVTVSFPYRGDAALWRCKSSTSTLSPPRARVREGGRNVGTGLVDLALVEPSDSIGDGAKLRQAIDRTVNDIRQWIGWIAADVAAHNAKLRPRIEQQVRSRRERLAKHGNVLKALNIPLKKKADMGDLVALPMKKRVIRPIPQRPNGPPEHAITDEDYEFILKVIRHEGRSFETTPATFAKHGEEELRDFILAHLNTHYEGQATGEAFRKKGKTDIRIEHENRAAFVAECKVWRGAKSATDAVSQLLGYLTWRDCKASLVLFNTENAGFKELQDKLPTVLQAHPRFNGELRSDEPGEWRFRFMSEDDDGRYVIVHVFLVNLYVKWGGADRRAEAVAGREKPHLRQGRQHEFFEPE